MMSGHVLVMSGLICGFTCCRPHTVIVRVPISLHLIILAAIGDHCLNLLFSWGLQNYDVLSILLHLLDRFLYKEWCAFFRGLSTLGYGSYRKGRIKGKGQHWFFISKWWVDASYILPDVVNILFDAQIVFGKCYLFPAGSRILWRNCSRFALRAFFPLLRCDELILCSCPRN